MAPELVEGQPASVRSDLFALGLVLHEICTGKRATISTNTDAATPALVSGLADVPVALQHVIQRCLQRDPMARPASALAVMAALPGGDPLQAAMAAGETPSPAMVAAAGTVGTLRVGLAWSLLLAGFAGLLLLMWLSASSTLVGRVAPTTSPIVLAERARAILKDAGISVPAVDSHYAYLVDQSYFQGSSAVDRKGGRWDDLAASTPGPLLFLYRQSAEPMVALRTTIRPFGPAEAGRVTQDDPPTNLPGMADVLLDQRGRLVSLRVVGSPEPDGAGTRKTPNWDSLLTAATFDLTALKPTAPRAVLPVAANQRIAWMGPIAGAGDVPMHVEAAALDGELVWFGVQPLATAGIIMPLAAISTAITPVPPAQLTAMWTLLLCSVLLWVGIAVLLRRNLRLGRSDRAGAFKVSSFLFLSAFLALLLRADHVALAFEEAGLISNLLAQTLLFAAVVWSSYIALEPVARRRWPQLLVGWTRLVSGRWTDPLVGCNALIGGLAGISMALVLHLAIVIPDYWGWSSPVPRGRALSSLAELRHLAHFALWTPFAAVVVHFGTLLGWLIFHRLLRNRWLTLATLAMAQYLGLAAITGADQLWSVATAVFTAIYLGVTLRAGLLAGVVALYVFLLLEVTPLTLDWTVWYADRTWLTGLVLATILVYGFRTALASQPLFGGVFDDD